MNFFIGLTAAATTAIAVLTLVNYLFIRKLKARDDEFREEVMRLYWAVIMSNLSSRERDINEHDWKTIIQSLERGWPHVHDAIRKWQFEIDSDKPEEKSDQHGG